MENNQLWNPVYGFEGLYEVSPYGTVKSVARVTTSKKSGNSLTVKERILKPNIDRNGYHMYALSKDGVLHRKRVHTIVAESFLGHRREKTGLVVDHIDGNPSNNTLWNLQLISHSENIRRSRRNTETPNTRPYKGKYKAELISRDNTCLCIGIYDNIVDAEIACQEEILCRMKKKRDESIVKIKNG